MFFRLARAAAGSHRRQQNKCGNADHRRPVRRQPQVPVQQRQVDQRRRI